MNLLNLDKYEFSKEIIKEPFLSFYIAEILRFFPNAKFIFALEIRIKILEAF